MRDRRKKKTRQNARNTETLDGMRAEMSKSA